MFHPPHPISFPRQNMCARLVGMHVMESEFPIKLARRMQEQVIEDKVWSLSVNRSRKADYMLQHILVSVPSHNKTGSTKDALQPGTETPLSLLTDELVTGICVPLLPRCAYSEIKERTLLEQSLLNNYFLGQLVAAVLLTSM